MPRLLRVARMMRPSRPAALLALAALVLPSAGVQAHGILGSRFFPATLASDDPFAADELAFPTVSSFDSERDFDLAWSKSIFQGMAVEFASGYVNAHPRGGPAMTGWDNLEIQPSVEFYRDADSQTILTAAFSWEIGGSGSKAVASRASTYAPTVKYGKGFGDLPDGVWFLKPFAITGTVDYAVSGRNGEPNAMEWGGALEYSLLYLQNNVRDQGFGNFVAHLTPVIEYSFSAPLAAGAGGTTGTIDPGIIWSGQQMQFAIEAVIPANGATGRAVGVIAQLHFYLDDIFPRTLGRPIFGGSLS